MIDRDSIFEFLGVNSNDLDYTSPIMDVTHTEKAVIQIKAKTGAHAVHVFEVECGAMMEDGTVLDWLSFNDPVTLDQIKYIEVDTTYVSCIRLKLKTKEDATSTVDIVTNTYSNG